MAKINFKGVQTEFVPLPEGSYEAVFTGFTIEKAKDDSHYYKLEYTISDEDFAGRKLWRNFSVKDQALWAFKRTLVDMGVDGDDLDDEVDVDDILEDLKGTDVVLEVTQREHEDKIYNDIAEIGTGAVV